MNIHLPRTFAAKNIMKRFIIVAMVLLCSGCGRNDGRVAVAGKTALDGTPIAEGMINFFPTGETKGPTAGGVHQGWFLFDSCRNRTVCRTLPRRNPRSTKNRASNTVTRA